MGCRYISIIKIEVRRRMMGVTQFAEARREREEINFARNPSKGGMPPKFKKSSAKVRTLSSLR